MEIKCPEGNAPLYNRYPGQSEPQDAFIELNLNNDSLRAGYNPELGGGVPFAVHHGHWRRYGVPANASGDALRELMESEEVKGLCERIINGYASVWDGHNYVAELDDDAREAEEELERLVSERFEHDYAQTAVWKLDEWLNPMGDDADGAFNDVTAFTSDAGLEEAVRDVRAYADDQDVDFEEDVEEFLDEHRFKERGELIETMLDADDTVQEYHLTEESEGGNPVYEVERTDGAEFTVSFNPDGNLAWDGRAMSREQVEEMREKLEGQHAHDPHER